MKNNVILRKVSLRGAYLFIGMLLAFFLSGKAFAGNANKADQYYGPVGLKLSGQSEASDRVKATAYIVDEKAYYDLVGQRDMLFCWDSEADGEKVNAGSEYEIRSNGRHYLNVYISGENGIDLYCTMDFEIDNIDAAAPSIGAIKKVPDSGMWRICAEGCSDDHTSNENLRYICLSERDADKYRTGDGWDRESLIRNEGSSRNSDFTVEEGRYCYFVIDEAQNAAEMDIETGHIDTEPPYFVGEPVLYSEGGANGYASAVVVSVKADDAEGLNPYPYSFDDGKTWRDNCDIRVTDNCSMNIRVRDAAGNEGVPVTVNIDNIDNEPPKLSLSQEVAEPGVFRVKVHAEDNISGVGEISYREEGSSIPLILAPAKGSAGKQKDTEVLINKNGTYIFSVKDAALNSTSEKISIVRTVIREEKENIKDNKTIKSRDSEKKDENVKESSKNGSGEKTGQSKTDEAKEKNKDKKNDSSKDRTKENVKENTKENKKENAKGTEKTFYGSNPGKKNDNKKNYTKTGESVRTIYVNEGVKPAESSSADRIEPVKTEKTSGIGKFTSYVKKAFTKEEEKEEEEEDDKDTVSSDMKYDVYRLDEDEDTDISGTEEEITESMADEAVTEDRGKEISDEDLLPGLLNEEAHSQGISTKAGKVIMGVLILLILTALTFVLLIRFNIISIPKEEEAAAENI